ncbi:MAG: hypothetical protein HN919_05035 [Verrucomicrobia bacterium]|jgi:ABC-type Fe3+ transport system permease subunit|nr:hypothetical protein [Verrucomicrobiota bacterium]MBT7065644.1 hypothetical protein [Verrucomicrobiota bacterium]MBT7700205.1 hypothetical protein [Verrucomicrobiota bacterium]
MLSASSCSGLSRALLIGVAAVPLGYAGAAALASRCRTIRLAAWGGAVACFFAPPLLTGYAYANFTGLPGVASSVRSLCYGLLVLARLLPVAAVLWLICPGQVSREAWHAVRLAWPRLTHRMRLVHAWQQLCHGSAATAAAVLGAVFVLAFTEFELAAFLGVEQWTVTIFDAQVGGMSLAASLRRVALPAAMAGGLAVAVVLVLRASRPVATGGASPRRGWAPVGLAVFMAGALLVAVVPGAIVVRGVWPGALTAWRGFGLGRELASSLLVAAAAGGLACVAAGLVCRRSPRPGRQALQMAGVIALLVPGLLGGLVVGLLFLAMLQVPLLWILRSTPLPLIVAASLMVMPVALLIQLLLRGRRRVADLHLARLLAASPDPGVRRRATSLSWVRGSRPLFWAAALLIYQVFSDITLASLLAPLRMPLVMPRLYNFMHYGRSAVLTSSLLIAVVVPLAALTLASFTYRIWRARHAATLDM